MAINHNSMSLENCHINRELTQGLFHESKSLSILLWARGSAQQNNEKL